MKNLLFLLVIIVFISCSEKKSESSKLKKTESKINDSVTFLKLGNYKGKIGTNLDVLFHFKNDKNKISGFYYYKKIGVDIQIVGDIKKDSLIAYELDYKKDTLAIIKGKINRSKLKGKWINLKNKKEYPIIIEKTEKEITSLPKNFEGIYHNKKCDLTLSLFKLKGEYFYKYNSSERKLEGKISFDRGDNLYINLENIEYSEDYFDISLPEENFERIKEYERLKKIGKRKTGIECSYSFDEITIQNYGNSMNYYVKLYDCGEKYIHFQKQ